MTSIRVDDTLANGGGGSLSTLLADQRYWPINSVKLGIVRSRTIQP